MESNARVLISDVLAKKSGGVIAVHVDETVQGAAQVLMERGIGMVAVLDDERKFVGLLSEQDLVRAIATTPDQLTQFKVSDLMTRDVVVCEPNSTVKEVMETMRDRGFRHMPVVVDGQIKGIIGRSDLLNLLNDEEEYDFLESLAKSVKHPSLQQH